MTAKELETIVLPRLPMLYRIARRMVSGSSEAEDVVGTTLLEAFRHCASCDGQFPLAWVVQILRRTAGRSRKQSERHMPDTDWDEDLHIDPKGHHQILDHVAHLDLVALLDQLPEHYRFVVSLIDMEEWDYEETAKALDIPVGTVRSRLSRGRKMLQYLITKNYEAPI